MKEEDDKAKRLIKNLGVEKPSVDLMSKVMADVDLLAAEDLQKDEALESIVTRAGVESTPDLFTYRLMTKINEEIGAPAKVYEPVISRKVWAFIGSFALMFVLFAVFSAPGNHVSPIDLPNLDVDEFLHGFSSGMTKVLTWKYVLASMVLFSVYLMVDLYTRNPQEA